MRRNSLILFILFLLLLSGCGDSAWNNPHKSQDYGANVSYSSFFEAPKTLDPAQSYSADEILFTAQIYEPPLQYHYLKRPYTVTNLTATAMPIVGYWDAQGNPLPANTPANQIATTTYDIHIQPGILYQPHPAFAKDAQGHYRYHALSKDDLNNISQLSDFKYTGTRELVAADYVYEIKRLAHPAINSPILGVMGDRILGLTEYSNQLGIIYDQQTTPNGQHPFLDLRNYPLAGAQVIDQYTYRITLKGVYPQFLFWLTMPFFAPVPWEADLFYSQPGMSDKDISFDWYPIGTGPYMLTENNPNKQMVLSRNPNFSHEYYPTEGDPGDKEAGYLDNAGKPLPLIDKFVFSLEKESIPRWNKFLQGFYDESAITSDSYDQAIHVDEQGNLHLTSNLMKRGIRLQSTVTPSMFYIGFNMLDSVVGGDSETARKLRLAISIAINEEEFISIFLNGRGIPAQGPLPPGIFGFLMGPMGINPYVYDWVDNAPMRKPITVAKQLMAEAGYPEGRNKRNGEALILNYDTVSTSAPDDKAMFDWMRKQFNQLGIELNVQSTQYNRFQEKMRTGDTQLFSWGWLADYPDPENFLFLLYGPNGEAKHGGENSANYQNATFDSLFEQMKNMPNGPERQLVINQMVDIVRHDSPWVWGFYPKNFILIQQWVNPFKPNAVANNVLKYQSLDPALRAKLVEQWNKPNVWPLALLLLALVLVILPAFVSYWRRLHQVRNQSLF